MSKDKVSQRMIDLCGEEHARAASDLMDAGQQEIGTWVSSFAKRCQTAGLSGREAVASILSVLTGAYLILYRVAMPVKTKEEFLQMMSNLYDESHEAVAEANEAMKKKEKAPQ